MKETNETKELAKKFRKASISNFNLKSNKMQYELQDVLVQEIEELLNSIEQGSVKPSFKATNNMIKKIQ